MYNNRKDLTNGDYNYLVYCVVFCSECLGGIIVLTMAIERYYLICKANKAKSKLSSSRRKKIYLAIVSGFLLALGCMVTDVALHYPKFVSILTKFSTLLHAFCSCRFNFEMRGSFFFGIFALILQGFVKQNYPDNLKSSRIWNLKISFINPPLLILEFFT